MGESTTTKKRKNKLVEIIRHIIGGAGDADIGSKLLWGGSAMLAATITTIFIMVKKKQSLNLGKKQGAVKKSCITMNRDIEEICINGFRLALHNPSRPSYHHAWSSSLSEMGISGIDGEDSISTKYLISEGKIVLQVQWKHETSGTSKEEMVIFDDLQTRDDNHCTLNTKKSMTHEPSMSTDNLPSEDPIERFIPSDKDNCDALVQLVGATSTGEIGEIDEPMEESTADGINEEVSHESASLDPREVGSDKAVIVQWVSYKITRHMWIILAILGMVMLLVCPKHPSALLGSLFSDLQIYEQ